MAGIVNRGQPVLFIIGVGVNPVIGEVAVGVIGDDLGSYRIILIKGIYRIGGAVSRGAVAHTVISITVRLAASD
jgi:hypothetical protein